MSATLSGSARGKKLASAMATSAGRSGNGRTPPCGEASPLEPAAAREAERLGAVAAGLQPADRAWDAILLRQREGIVEPDRAERRVPQQRGADGRADLVAVEHRDALRDHGQAAVTTQPVAGAKPEISRSPFTSKNFLP